MPPEFEATSSGLRRHYRYLIWSHRRLPSLFWRRLGLAPDRSAGPRRDAGGGRIGWSGRTISRASWAPAQERGADDAIQDR